MLDELDPIIDDVAREMTSASADANFARRVAARIADVPPRSTPLMLIRMRPVLLAPVAAVFAIVVAVFVARGRKPVAPAPAPVVAVAPEPTPVEQVERVRVQRSERVFVRRQRVAPLPAVQEVNLTPIVVDSVDVAPIVRVEQIDIDPIAISRIEIPPMP